MSGSREVARHRGALRVALYTNEYDQKYSTRLHPQGRWPEGPPSAAHVSLCLTFGTLKLHSSPLKPSKSGPQNLKNTYFWDPETPFFAPETFKI